MILLIILLCSIVTADDISFGVSPANIQIGEEEIILFNPNNKEYAFEIISDKNTILQPIKGIIKPKKRQAIRINSTEQDNLRIIFIEKGQNASISISPSLTVQIKSEKNKALIWLLTISIGIVFLFIQRFLKQILQDLLIQQ